MSDWLKRFAFRYSIGRNESIRTPEPLTEEQLVKINNMKELWGVNLSKPNTQAANLSPSEMAEAWYEKFCADSKPMGVREIFLAGYNAAQAELDKRARDFAACNFERNKLRNRVAELRSKLAKQKGAG